MFAMFLMLTVVRSVFCELQLCVVNLQIDTLATDVVMQAATGSYKPVTIVDKSVADETAADTEVADQLAADTEVQADVAAADTEVRSDDTEVADQLAADTEVQADMAAADIFQVRTSTSHNALVMSSLVTSCLMSHDRARRLRN